jgi:hypothetical protein
MCSESHFQPDHDDRLKLKAFGAVQGHEIDLVWALARRLADSATIND